MNRDSLLARQTVHEEAQQFAHLHGGPRLAAIWQAMEAVTDPAQIDLKTEWIRTLLQAAWKEARIDYTLRGFSLLRELYATDVRCVDLRNDVLWYYKWLVEALPEHADASLEVIEKIFADMQAFYEAEKESVRPIYALRCQAAVFMGKRDDAAMWFEKWQHEPGGKSDDCEACEIGREVLYLIDREQHTEAIEAAELILRGKAYCDDTPETLTRLIGTAAHLGNKRLAMAILRGTSRVVRRVPSMQASLAAHVWYRLLLGDLQRSRRLALVALRRAKETRNDYDLFSTYRACGMWAALAFLAGQKESTVPRRILPGAATDAAEKVKLPDVAELCLQEARRIGNRLDARNGTSRYNDRLSDFEAAIRRITEPKGRQEPA
jgi:hypothetical protein